ncbi:unnamed protein product [Vicia faba]|uniref:Uncharacterized protein n=1 Tax=Vicia faba TaxID=3906 RepID=A0AAV1ACJ8_VICFA|nr:unnamed protein product [Vicia faba]
MASLPILFVFDIELTLDVIDHNTVNVEDAIQLVVDAVTSCRFEVTYSSFEEDVLIMCMKSKVAVILSNQHVSTIVNTCFRIVHQAGSKCESLLQISQFGCLFF